jgi:hypothetical protein
MALTKSSAGLAAHRLPRHVQCEEALNWAMHVPNAALAQRCLQVARALSPALSPAVADTLLSALMQCAAHPSAVALDFMAEVLITLRELLEASEPQQVRGCTRCCSKLSLQMCSSPILLADAVALFCVVFFCAEYVGSLIVKLG